MEPFESRDGFGVTKEGFGTGRIIEINVNHDENARILVTWDDPSISGVLGGWYLANELEFIKVFTANPKEHLKQALNIIKEFVEDIEKRGLEIVGEDWPELLITYQHAVEVLS